MRGRWAGRGRESQESVYRAQGKGKSKRVRAPDALQYAATEGRLLLSRERVKATQNCT